MNTNYPTLNTFHSSCNYGMSDVAGPLWYADFPASQNNYSYPAWSAIIDSKIPKVLAEQEELHNFKILMRDTGFPLELTLSPDIYRIEAVINGKSEEVFNLERQGTNLVLDIVATYEGRFHPNLHAKALCKVGVNYFDKILKALEATEVAMCTTMYQKWIDVTGLDTNIVAINNSLLGKPILLSNVSEAAMETPCAKIAKVSGFTSLDHIEYEVFGKRIVEAYVLFGRKSGEC